jgi:hypothetical protein
MERTYADKDMIKPIPTGIEIIQNNNLKDQLLIEIPHSRYHLHGLKQPNKNWNLSIINPLGGCKRNIIENISAKDFACLITTILADKSQTEFKKEPAITRLKKHYKSLIKGFKA